MQFPDQFCGEDARDRLRNNAIEVTLATGIDIQAYVRYVAVG
jgi:hypothetical protein